MQESRLEDIQDLLTGAVLDATDERTIHAIRNAQQFVDFEREAAAGQGMADRMPEELLDRAWTHLDTALEEAEESDVRRAIREAQQLLLSVEA